MNSVGRKEEYEDFMEAIYGLRRCFDPTKYVARRKEVEYAFMREPGSDDEDDNGSDPGQPRNPSQKRRSEAGVGEEDGMEIDDDTDPEGDETDTSIPQVRRKDFLHQVYDEDDDYELNRPRWFMNNHYSYADSVVDALNFRAAGLTYDLRGTNV